MSVSDVLDGAFATYKRSARTIFTASAALVVPVQMVVAFLQRGAVDVRVALTSAGDPAAPGGGVGAVATGVALVAQMFVVSFVAAAVSRVVAGAYLGEAVGPGAALAEVRRRWPAILGAWALVHVWEGLVWVAGGIVTAVLAAAGLRGLALVALVVTLPLGSLWALVWAALLTATTPALVVEGLRPVAALRRSARLLRGRVWGVLGIGLLAGLVSFIAGGVLGFTPQAVGAALGPDRGGWVLVGAGGALSSLLTTPFVAIVATLLYFDGRIRTEGFDLEVIAATLEGSAR
jgi:hypothetical protein